MDRIYKILITIAIVVQVTTLENTKCPKYCHCDLFEELNRADCSYKRLISPLIEIPPNVEILCLSYNDISALEDKSFEGLQHIRNLTLDNNAIETIFLDAFIDLISLQHVDLSYNRLEYFDPRIFENNRHLISVNLDGNKFMNLVADKPFLISPTIEQLSLHESHLMQTTASQFSKLPLLSKLDLSDNLMITLNVATFLSMSQLKYLNVLNNRWTTCHSDLKSTVDYLRGKTVEIRINVCNFDPTEKKFERMMMAPASEVTSEATETDITYIWKNISLRDNRTNLECRAENLQEICYLYETCNVKYGKVVTDQTIQHFKSRLFDQADPVYVALYSGLFLGFFVTISVVYVIYLICGSRYWKKRRLQKRIAERRRYMASCGNNIRNPMPIPRPLRPARPPPTRPLSSQPLRHAINRANQREFLLARLFERPERRRHYNLTPNRGPHIANNLDTEQLIRNSPSDEILSPISLAIEDVPVIDIHIQETIEEIEEPPRAETPPPSYNDIVK